MSYRVELSDRAEQKLKSLPLDLQEAFLEDIAELAQNPLPLESVTMEDFEGYRFVNGDLRIVYALRGDALVVLGLNVWTRKFTFDRTELYTLRKKLKKRK